MSDYNYNAQNLPNASLVEAIMGNKHQSTSTIPETPEAIELLHQKGNKHLQEHQWQQALDTFLTILNQNSEDENALCGLARALDNLNRFDTLMQVALRLLEIDPMSAPGLAFKARALQKMERISEATIANDQALLLDTRLPQAWINRCGLQLLQGKFPEALKSAYRALDLASDDTRAWANYGVALLNFNRLGEALEAFDHSLALDPTHLFALQMKCEILCRIGRMREVVPLVERALSLNAQNIPSLMHGIQAFRTLEMYESLQILADSLLKLMPDNPFGLENYMRSLRGQGKFEEANTILDRILELEPANVRFWTLKADTLYRLERYREAAGIAQQACRIDPTYPPARRIQEKALRLMYQRKDKRKGNTTSNTI